MSQLPPARRIKLAPFEDDLGRQEESIQLSVSSGGEGPAVVLCHGFPELAYSWRHQYPALVNAGFHVVVPDQRGYGGSDTPAKIESYDLSHLTTDMIHLMDALEIEKAIFAGHDWGGFVAWAMPILHPERTAGVIGVNTPYLARTPMPPTQLFSLAVGGEAERLYILWFQEPGVAEGVLDLQPRLLFEKLMRRSSPPAEMVARAGSGPPDMNPFRRLEELETLGDPMLEEEELNFYVAAFEAKGFHGPISWYRNLDRNWELLPEIGAAQIDHPALMVTAEWDVALTPAMADDMPSRCSDLETVMIPECGHWTQQEKPAELNEILVSWLTRKFA